MNLLEVEWAGDGKVHIARATVDAPIHASGLQPGTKLLLGMRPEHMAVTAAGPDTIKAKVDFSEYLGGNRFLYCQLDDGQNLTVEQRDGPDILPGEILHLTTPLDRRRFFAATGERLW